MVRFAPADFEFLTEVQRLGDEGKTQEQISRTFGLTQRQFRYRLERLGYTPDARTQVCRLGDGARLVDLIERGEVLAADANGHAEPERAEVVA